MSTLDFLFAIAVILFSTKFLGLLMRKLGLPQVLGFILAGILIGPAIWCQIFPKTDFGGWLLPIQSSAQLKTFAEIGVILVMFAAGLETDLQELKRTGLVSFLIALGGVLVPLGIGFGIGALFLGTENLLSCLFVGVIITATSVGITVETLRELGKLKGRVGTTIVSAAIIDDVIGIIILSVAMSLDGASGNTSAVLEFINPKGNPVISTLWMILFFVVAIGVGYLLSRLFKRMEQKHPKTRRQLIYALVVCFLYSFVAEKVFGVADITGAYLAGVVLSTDHRSAQYMDKRVNTNTYMIFGPIFFANIGICMSFNGFTPSILLFGLVFVVGAILGKIVGCGLICRACKFNLKDSLKVGVGMIARGEVALIVANKGIEAGLLEAKYLAIVIMLVLVSSILAPILLKLLFKGEEETPNDDKPSTDVLVEDAAQHPSGY